MHFALWCVFVGGFQYPWTSRAPEDKIKRVEQNYLTDNHVPQASTSTGTATTSGQQMGAPGSQQVSMPSAKQSQQPRIPASQQASSSGTSQVLFDSQMLEK